MNIKRDDENHLFFILQIYFENVAHRMGVQEERCLERYLKNSYHKKISLRIKTIVRNIYFVALLKIYFTVMLRSVSDEEAFSEQLF